MCRARRHCRIDEPRYGVRRVPASERFASQEMIAQAVPTKATEADRQGKFRNEKLIKLNQRQGGNGDISSCPDIGSWRAVGDDVRHF